MEDLQNTSSDIVNSHVKNVIIVGGGFAGVNLARQLLKSKNYQVTLVDKNNYNFFPPLLYQVSTSFLDPSSISYPFRKLFRGERINLRMSELVKIDTNVQMVYLNDGEIHYDYLVFATGAKINFYGIESVEKNALPMKTVDDALRMRNALLRNIEQATVVKDPLQQAKMMNIVVAGGGPTGVEVTGMLAELRKFVLAKDYPELKCIPGSIYIVEGKPRLLGPMSEKSNQKAHDALENLGVKIKLNTHIISFENGIVELSTGETVETRTLIWTAGITAARFEGIPTTSIGFGNRMITDQFNKVIGLDRIYAIGDTSIQKTDLNYPNGHPQLAQVAIQQGLNLAKNFIAISEGKPKKPFKYFDKGDMAIIGRNVAVVDLFKHKVFVSGILGLLIWLFVHLIALVNYRNKIRTFLNWFEAYLSRDQSLRTIFRS